MDILKVFTQKEIEEFEDRGDGTLRGICPACGFKEGYEFVIFLETNKAYCRQSKNTFSALEVIALKHGLISCYDKQPLEESNG